MPILNQKYLRFHAHIRHLQLFYKFCIMAAIFYNFLTPSPFFRWPPIIIFLKMFLRLDMINVC